MEYSKGLLQRFPGAGSSVRKLFDYDIYKWKPARTGVEADVGTLTYADGLVVVYCFKGCSFCSGIHSYHQ
jgi:hypothetical protein